MNKIHKKIIMLTTLVILIMSTIWIASTYFHQKTQDQYNDILQRYLTMNEVTRGSHQIITDLNNYILTPNTENLKQLELSKRQMKKVKNEVFKLRNEENNFTLTNYTNLIESFIETTDRLILFHSNNDTELSTKQFKEATRISNYISEMTLTLIDKELRTYDLFYRDIIKKSEVSIKLGILVLLLITLLLLLGSYLFSLSITKPVHKLTQAANELSKGRFDLQIKIDTNDEMAFLGETFDRMRINITNLISEIKQKAQLERELQQNKILLQESQFRSLQSQINPHFLFNTLNTVSKRLTLKALKKQEISLLVLQVYYVIT